MNKRQKHQLNSIAADVSTLVKDPSFQTFFNQSLIACVVVNTNHELVAVNDPFCEMLGFDRESLTGKSYLDITHPDDIEKSKELGSRVFVHPKPQMTTKRYLRKDGSALWVQLSLSPFIVDGTFTGLVVGQLIDMSELMSANLELERNQASLYEKVKNRTAALENANRLLNQEIHARDETQKALAMRERQYRQVFDCQTEMVCQFLPDTTLTLVNHAYARFFQSTPEALVGRKFLEFIPESDHQTILKHLAAMAEIGQSRQYEHQVRLPDGHLIWLAWHDQVLDCRDGKPCLFQSLGRDISKQKDMETQLSSSEKRLRFALESSGMDWFDWNPQTDELIMSDLWVDRWSFPRDKKSATSSDWLDKIHPDDLPMALQQNYDLLKGKIDTLSVEYRIRSKSDEWCWVHTRARVMTWEGDRAARVIGTSVDITQRRAVQDQLRKAKEDAEVAALTKTQFLANISHEIRTPLNGILGTADWLANLDQLPKEFADGISIIRESSTGLLNLINDILDFSRLETERLSLIPFAFQSYKLMNDLQALFEATIRERKQHFVLEPDPAVPEWLFGDANRLRQVLINIIGNAIKFTPDGGTITLSSRLVETGKDSLRLSFQVRDTGIGIPKDKQQDIFQRFTQADPSTTRHFGGSGLGLAISAHLVELMDGSLKVESEPGEGSVFTLDVRLGLVGTIENPEERTGPLPRLEQLTILVVEDNPVNQRVVARLLEAESHQVTMASNGKEALAILEKQAFDLVLMDIQMPGMDGFETIGRIRRREANTGQHQIVIALTAMAMAEDRNRCIEAGMDDYIPHPFAVKIY